MSYSYEQLSDMYDNDPKLWSMLDWENDSLPDLTEADLYPDEEVSEPDEL
jgi:hypothetical protein